MSAERPTRIRFELWFAYLLPLPPVAAGFVWTVLLGGSGLVQSWLEMIA